MKLLTQLGLLGEKRPVICIAGAGGKTTLLYKLCDELRTEYKKISAFTTTHILRPQESDRLACIFDDDICLAQAQFENGKIVIAGTKTDENKITMPSDKILQFLLSVSNAIVAEVDGSRNLPIKFPNPKEPCLLEDITCLLAVGGLKCLGQPLSAVCHRWPLAMAECGFSGQNTVATEEMMAKILHTGYGKYNPIYVLNQADDEQTVQKALIVKEILKEKGARCVITSLQNDLVW